MSGGLPVWHVSEPYVDLWITDEPFAYRTSSGGIVSLKLAYKEIDVERSVNLFGFGPNVECSWLSYIEYHIDTNNKPAPDYTYVPLGGIRSYLADGVTPEYGSSTTMTNINDLYGHFLGFQITKPDGSRDFYDSGYATYSDYWYYWNEFLLDYQLTCLLGQSVDAAGRTNRFVYDWVSNPPPPQPGPALRLSKVVDSSNRTNLVFYDNGSSYPPDLIQQINDPYGHNIIFSYDYAYRLLGAVNLAGMYSSFSYDSQAPGYLTNLMSKCQSSLLTLLVLGC